MKRRQKEAVNRRATIRQPLGRLLVLTGIAIVLASCGTIMPASPIPRTPAAQPTQGSGYTVFNVKDYGAKADGKTDDGAAIQSAVGAAIKAGGGTVYLPGGTYLVDPTKGTIAIPGNDITLAGDGGTIIETPSKLSYPAGTSIMVLLSGSQDAVHDIHFIGPASFTGTGGSIMVSVTAGAFQPHVYDIECSSINGGGDAGGDCIDTYQPQTVDHSYQYGRFENVYIHDSPHATAIIATSSGNIFDKIRISNIGVLNTQHGFYISGGDNVISNSTIAGVSGWGVQIYPGSSSEDLTGNRIIGTTFRDNKAGNFNIVAGDTNVGGVPAVGHGVNLTRATVIDDDHFFYTSPSATFPVTGWSVGSPIIVTNSIIEGDLVATKGPCIAHGNIFNDTGFGRTGLNCGPGSVVSGNSFNFGKGPADGIAIGPNSIFEGNVGNVALSSILTSDSTDIFQNNVFTPVK